MKILKILYLLPFLLLASCETISDWTESIIPGDEEAIEDGENNQELVADQELRDPSLEEILADSENEESFEIADEQLSATPAKEYDSVLIDENKEVESLDNTPSQSSEIINEDPSETIDNILAEQKATDNQSFKAPESLLSSLNLKEKIQYRVATINFRSGSSSVDGNGPIHALDKALRHALIKYYPSLKKLNLIDYKVRILTPQDGTKALVRVRIESSNQKFKWSTIGVSYNVIDASYIALHDSITYHLLMT